jgi:hypothetical protein
MVATSRVGEEGKRTWAAGDFIALREEGESKLEKEAVWAEADKGKGAGRLRIGLIVREPWKRARAGEGIRTACETMFYYY